MTTQNEDIYEVPRWTAEWPDNYRDGKLAPIYLGDTLDNRYKIFRKLAFGSHCTVWLAKDLLLGGYAALKVHGAGDCYAIKERIDHLNVESVRHEFFHNNSSGSYLCTALEPLGRTLRAVIDQKIFAPRGWSDSAARHKIYDPHRWSVTLAREICRQVLVGLDSLHSQGIAHRDMHTGNIAYALTFDLDSMTMDEIQEDHFGDDDPNWEPSESFLQKSDVDDGSDEDASDSEDDSEEDEEEDEGGAVGSGVDSKDADKHTNDNSEQDSHGQESDQDDDSDSKPSIQDADLDDTARVNDLHFDNDWDAENFRNAWINWVHRIDKKPLEPTEIQYTVPASPLHDRLIFDNLPPFRIVLIDLGSSRKFGECNEKPQQPPNYRPPESIFPMPVTYKADIFSAGLVFWEVFTTRNLVWSHRHEGKTDYKQYIKDLAIRLGPVPDKYADVPLWGLGDEEPLDKEDFGYGDVDFAVRRDGPKDMTESEAEVFVDLVKRMLEWEPEQRPDTKELLKHPFFQDPYP